MPALPRRSVLTAAGVGALGLALGARARHARANGGAGDAYGTLGRRRLELKLGTGSDPPAGITRSYDRLNTMAEAYAQPGTGLTGVDFWRAGRAGGLTAGGPASVLVRRRRDSRGRRTAALVVSSPDRSGGGGGGRGTAADSARHPGHGGHGAHLYRRARVSGPPHP